MDQSDTATDLAELTKVVQRCRGSASPDTVRTCLAAAAALVEHAAYELARGPQSQHVSSLILVSAELERISQISSNAAIQTA